MAQRRLKCIDCGSQIRPNRFRQSQPVFGECCPNCGANLLGNDRAALVPTLCEPLNRFIYGINDITLDLSGYTVAQAVEALSDLMNYDPLTVAVVVDWKRVWDWEKFVLGQDSPVNSGEAAL